MSRYPQHTLKRLAAQVPGQIGAFSGYGLDSAPMSPLNGRWMVTPRSADSDTLRGLGRQRAESRELIATNPIATGAIDTNLQRIVGTGLQPVFMPAARVLGWSEAQAEKWAAAAAAEFSLWADGQACDWYGHCTFYELQALVLSAEMASGDCFTVLPSAESTTLMPYGLRLQVIEADRVGNPKGEQDSDTVVAGIRRPAGGGAASAAFVYDRHPGGAYIASTLADRFTGQWIDLVGESGRRRVLHHYRMKRPEQTRGVPYLAPVVQAIRDIGRYSEAEITAAVISAYFTVFIKSPSGAGPAPVFGAAAAPPAGGDIALAPGAVVGLAQGEETETANPGRPNPNAEPFINGMLKLIGMGLGIPYELLVKQFNSSFSASKAALLDGWQHFRRSRAWLVNSFCQPVLETWLTEAISIGRLEAPGYFSDPMIRWAYTRAAWHGDSQGSINPKDEVAAYRDAVDSRFITRERAVWELFGEDFTRTYPAMRAEQQRLAGDGMLPPAKAGAAAPPPPGQPGAAPAQESGQ